MPQPIEWGHVASNALGPHRVRRAAARAYTFVPSGTSPIKLWEASSPGAAIYRHMTANNSGMRGYGQPPGAPAGAAAGGAVLGLTAGLFAALIIVGVIVNYQLGKAMAPNKQVESKWAWGNAIGGTVFPPFTIGMALYKNYFRD